MKKSNEAYKSIGEVAKILNLINKKNGSLNTHTIRFWEKEFKIVNPIILAKIIGFTILKKIKYLLKDQGMTIKGAKKALGTHDSFNLDDSINKSIKVGKKNLVLKKKVAKISKLIKEIKDLK